MSVGLLRSVRFWFALSVAVVSAALVDPLVESLSNAGCFGKGSFTDHSSLDVLPALALGICAVAVHLIFRLRATRHGDERERLRRLRCWDLAIRERAAALLPLTFAAQISVLYAMETIEQIVTAGHPLGGALWMGAPPAISLIAHALACVLLFFAATRCMHRLAWATLRIVKILQATFVAGASQPVVHVLQLETPQVRLPVVSSSFAGRAPPYSYVR